MPLNPEASPLIHTSDDSTPSSHRAARAARNEPRVSLARTIQLDALSRQTVPLRAVWRHLTEGAWLARSSFQTADRFYFVVEPRSKTATAPRPLPEQVTMLQRALLSERQKVMAYDTSSSCSTVATRLASCLNTMGFWPRASRVPALLVAMAAAEQGRSRILEARYTHADQDGGPQVIVSTPRLDSFLATRLTCEEFKVARLLVEGMTYANIALDRGSAVRTVANHISAIFRKLGVSGRAELLMFLAVNFRGSCASEAGPARSHVAYPDLTLPSQGETSENCPSNGAPGQP